MKLNTFRVLQNLVLSRNTGSYILIFVFLRLDAKELKRYCHFPSHPQSSHKIKDLAYVIASRKQVFYKHF